mmetsp:Transcript_5497/g.13229  ORF Transcript_5497/g.13229 Transcript_5497/m.13229 type:complete len:224 (-) Transcript_5497:226-897(-)
MTSRAELSILAVLIPAAICTLSEPANRFADIAVKCLWGWTLANGLMFYIYPSAIDAVYQTPQRDELVLLFRRNYGAKLISYALFGGAFSMNRDATEAVGSFWTAWLILTLLEVPSFKTMGLLASILYPMLALMAFFGDSLGLNGSQESGLILSQSQPMPWSIYLKHHKLSHTVSIQCQRTDFRKLRDRQVPIQIRIHITPIHSRSIRYIYTTTSFSYGDFTFS